MGCTQPRFLRRGSPRCNGCGGVAEFFNRRGRAGADGEGAAVEQRCDGSPASAEGIGTSYNGNAAAFGGRRGRESVRQLLGPHLST